MWKRDISHMWSRMLERVRDISHMWSRMLELRNLSDSENRRIPTSLDTKKRKCVSGAAHRNIKCGKERYKPKKKTKFFYKVCYQKVKFLLGNITYVKL